MDRRSFAAAITLGSAAALFGAQQASAAPPTDAMPRARNVVLVHGSMRSLSTSVTLRAATSATRRPAP